ncbi:SusC/RagA family TonB-linked outer membrane protein [Carboxylicivirga mesophila]|uniref:SusC/RagA family TonB-linked outer membrane protein n=1 Tax=Carboxylicivirga mesophila TaxID=1166478 RepID=A0ABS5KCB8_9BACT|nr:SusC/RagA family TonB-linked outer membrane protein [Carboxylicivirga mesophila]MBS2212635.1 SusC/RagA family TonB-linked outer membrane protein [Carboxylicivirga mesophila]
MKKYSSCSATCRKTSLGLIRALYVLFTITFLLFSGTRAIAQNIKLDDKTEAISVKELFKTIQKETGYRFFYNVEIEGLEKMVRINIKKKEIEEILNELKTQTNLQFRRLENNLIVVAPNDNVQESITVTGTIRSKHDNSPLPGVNVYIKGTTYGTISDTEGKYELKVDNPYEVIVFSFIGYELVEEPINGREKINIKLSEDNAALGEVVVTALNIARDKSSLGYSVTQINSDEVNEAKENNPINSLAGKVSGLQITKAPTGVDGSTRVVLRGISSIYGNNRPLFVIDGIPMDASSGGANRWGGTDGGDALSDLNPNDIESMSVLKGAGASALYGSRGANGVVLITTKKGLKRKGIGVTVNSSYSMETPMTTPNFQNKYGQGAFGSYPPLNGPNGPNNDHPWIWSYGPKMDGQTVVNWYGEEEAMLPQQNPYDEFFRTGSNITNSLSFEGGDENSSFRASITDQRSKGIVPNNNLNRQTLALRGFSKLGSKVEFDGKITYIHSEVENRPALAEDGANIVMSLDVLPRNIGLQSLRNNIYDENGNEFKWTSDQTFNNPYWILENIHNEDEKNRLQTMLSVKWEMIKDLNLSLRSGFDFINKRYMAYENTGRADSYNGLGYKVQSTNNNIEWNSDFLLAYHKAFNDTWTANLSIGGNYMYYEGRGLSQSGIKMKEPDFFHLSNYSDINSSEWFGQKEVYSLYGMTQIAYKNYVYLDLTYRNDWSSTLPLDNNSYGYHSENLSFLFSEAFNIKNHILSSGKLRASYAKVGNDTGAYQIDQYYGIVQSQHPYPMAYIGDVLPFYNLMPEETQSYEVGTDLKLLNNRLGIDATYYYSLSDKQIMSVDLAPTSGYGAKKMNAGEIENRGIELQLSGQPIQTHNGLNWDVSLTWSTNKNEVKQLYGDIPYLPLGSDFHAEIRAYPGQPYGQIYTTDFKRDQFGNKLIDDNGFPFKGDKKVMGNINPDWMAGLSNRLSYKTLSLNFLIDMQKGGDIYSWSKAYRGLFGTSVETLEGRDEWYAGTGGYVENGINENTGKPNTTAISPTYRWYHVYNKEIGAEWIQDGTNIRLREVVVNYTLPNKWMSKTPFTNVSISLVGRNLFFFYKAMEHVDPESAFGSGNVSTGFEHSSLPSTRSYGANLKVNF